jgi:hypothetical protein
LIKNIDTIKWGAAGDIPLVRQPARSIISARVVTERQFRRSLFSSRTFESSARFCYK